MSKLTHHSKSSKPTERKKETLINIFEKREKGKSFKMI
jgi:hypothetical protein